MFILRRGTRNNLLVFEPNDKIERLQTKQGELLGVQLDSLIEYLRKQRKLEDVK